MSMMSAQNEVPLLADTTPSALGLFRTWFTRDASGKINSAEVSFDVNYSMPAQARFSGLHIQVGGAGVNGAIVIPSGLTQQVDSSATGLGSLSYQSEANVGSAALTAALEGLQSASWNYYMNLHTTVSPAGVMRGQTRLADRASFQLVLLPANETATPPGLEAATAPSNISAYTLRGADGSIQAGTTIFDVNARFPGSVEFTGLHIHTGKAGENGGIVIPTSLSGTNSVIASTGAVNIYSTVLVPGGRALAALNGLLQNPENYYGNVHSRDFLAGVARAQLTAANAALPAITDVISAVSAPALKSAAPGGLMAIFETNLIKVASDLTGWAGDTIPNTINGTSVTIGGVAAPMEWVARVPFEVPAGTAPVVVKNSNGASAAFNVKVDAQAPGIFFGGDGGTIQKNSGFSLVTQGNPANVGDVVLIYGTGFGQTTPALATGTPAPSSPLANTAAATATIGGKSALPIYSLASPGLVGVYQVAARVPEVSGAAQVVATVGDVSSNAVTTYVK